MLFAAALAAGALLVAVAFPPGSPDRLPVLLLASGLGLFTAARPARGIVAFSFLFPCAGLLTALLGGSDPYRWPGLLLAGLLAGWTFRFIYDFESVPDPAAADGSLRAVLAVWTLSAVLAAARARTLWALAHGLSGRAVNGEGLSDAVALRESLFSFASLAGGAVFYFLLRRSGESVRARAGRAALFGTGLSAACAILQRIGTFPNDTRAFWKITGRLAGGAVDPNSLGLLCALLLPPALAGALRRGRASAASGVLFLLLAAGVVVSGSRSGVVVGLLSVALFAATRASSRRALWAALAAGLLVAVVGGILAERGGLGIAGVRLRQTFDPRLPLEYRVSERPVLWRAAERLFAAHPVEGGGMGAFAWRLPDLLKEDGRSLPTRDNPGSGYVQALAETGLVGFLLTLIAAAALGAQSWRRLREKDPDGPAAASAASVIVFLAALVAGSHWLAPDVSLLFFLLASTCAPRPAASESPGPFRLRRLSLALVLLYGAAAAVAIAATAAPSEAFRYAPRAGFHDREVGPGGPFRWTRRRFALWVRPGETVRLGLANFGPEGKPVRVTARAGGREVYQGTLAPGVGRAVRITGGGRPAAVLFVLDRSFVPRRLGVSGDRRVLGLLSTASNDPPGP